MTQPTGLLRTLLAAVVLWLAGTGCLHAGPVVDGPAERVFDWQTDRCALWDIPDTPARAWRDAEGRVQVVAGADPSRASVGPDLDHQIRDCAVLHRGARDDDPAAYDDRSWIAAVFTADGTRVEALAHVEYHGDQRPARCPAGTYAACWHNAIVELDSNDGGRSFQRLGAAVDLVAALPYPYDGRAGRRIGYFNPSNILQVGEHLYAFVFAEAYRAQARGPCLIRRPLDGRAADWRAWDGTDFRVRLADPYRERLRDPASHVCRPVAGIGSTISTVVRRVSADTYLALTPAVRPDPAGIERTGIWWMESADLIHWTTPALLWEVPLLWRRDCTQDAAYAYPSLLDGASASASFDTVGDRFWLYLVEMRVDAGCAVGPDRDLIRLPVSWPAR